MELNRDNDPIRQVSIEGLMSLKLNPIDKFIQTKEPCGC